MDIIGPKVIVDWFKNQSIINVDHYLSTLLSFGHFEESGSERNFPKVLRLFVVESEMNQGLYLVVMVHYPESINQSNEIIVGTTIATFDPKTGQVIEDVKHKFSGLLEGAFRCDDCNQSIINDGHHCLNCNYDLCHNCFTDNPKHWINNHQRLHYNGSLGLNTYERSRILMQ